VGNGTDFSAAISSGTISWAEGSFPTVSNVTSENDNGNSNDYSLQLNSNFFTSASLCTGASNPSNCQGWQQFIYAPGVAFMQYWLLNYGNRCPSGWNTFGSDCWKNSSSAVSVPTQPITNLANLTLTGTAGSSDSVSMSTGNGNLYTASQSTVVNLNTGWTTAEFNIVGDGNGTEAIFNSGATIVVQTLTDSATPTTNADNCASTGFTGETNNLNVVTNSCCPFGGEFPGIQFTESNASGATAQACPPEVWHGTAGNPAGYARSDGPSAVVYASPSGHVAELSLSGTRWSFGDLTNITGAPNTASAVAVYVRNDLTNAVVYRSGDNHIRELSLPKGSTSWQAGDLTGLTNATVAAGDPAAYRRSDGWSVVVYRGTDAHIHELGLAPGSGYWQVGDLTAAANAPNASGDPTGYVRADATNAVVFQSANSGDIYELRLPQGSASWQPGDLTSLTRAPAAAGKPRGYVRPDHVTSVVYRATNKDIIELALPTQSPSWQAWDLSAIANATAAASDPLPYVRSDDWSTVVYRGTDNHIHELGLAPGSSFWQVGDLSAITGAPAAVGGPTGYVRADNYSTVDFQSADSHVHELVLSGSSWSVADLTSLAGGP
jgi:hypothetical protein